MPRARGGHSERAAVPVALIGASPPAGSLADAARAGAPAVRRTGRPGVLLDRDGTIIVDRGYVGTIERVELIDGAADAIGRFNLAGVPVAVVSNQAGVARGLFSVDDVERVHRCIAGQLRACGAYVDRFLFCPYHPDGVVPAFARHSEDRKPRPGMALAAAAALDLDLGASWVIGDRAEDVGLAHAVGAEAIFVGPRPCPRPGATSLPSLAEAAALVLERLAA